MSVSRRFNRRDFLRRMGASAFLLPFIPGMSAKAATTSAYPTRAIFMWNGDGTIDENLWPTGTETDFTFPPGSILEPLAPVQSRMIAIRNLRRMLRAPEQYGEHERNIVECFTGGTLNPGNEFGGGGFGVYASVDQILAKTINPPTRYPTLEYAAMPQGLAGRTRMIYAGSNQPLTPMFDPVATFQRVFSNFLLPPAQQQADFQQRKSVLDLLVKQLGMVRTEVSSADYQKIDDHLTAIRELEASLQPGGTAVKCAIPTESGTIDLTANDNYPIIVKAQLELLLRSVACDLTRIASMQFSISQCLLYFHWIGVTQQHHLMTHSPSVPQYRAWRTLIQRYYATQVSTLAQALAAIPEGDGTMLDNTIILWTNESGDIQGPSDPMQAHNPDGAPTILIGGGGGYFRTGTTGRYLANTGRQWYAKQTLVNVCHAMGAPSINNIGDSYGALGAIPDLVATSVAP